MTPHKSVFQNDSSKIEKDRLGIPYLKYLEPECFRFLWTLEYSHTHDEMFLGMKSKSKCKVHLCFINILYREPEGHFIPYF
jgi:hypothetical protein